MPKPTAVHFNCCSKAASRKSIIVKALWKPAP
jgi:hypothetical protein